MIARATARLTTATRAALAPRAGRRVDGARASSSDAEGSSASSARGRSALLALALAAFAMLALAPLASAAGPSRTELPALSHAGFTNPCGAATDSTGALYVADQETSMIDVYADPEEATPINEIPVSLRNRHGFRLCPIAVDSAGDVYISSSFRGSPRNTCPPARHRLLAPPPTPKKANGSLKATPTRSPLTPPATRLPLRRRRRGPGSQDRNLRRPGGTYKLGFEGSETGWTGSAPLVGEEGIGDVTRATGGKGTWSTGSTTLTITQEPTSGSFAVGQLITATGITAASETTITACSTTCNEVGSTLTLSHEPTSSKTNTTITAAGGVEVTSGGPFVVGHTIEGAGIPANATINVITGSTLTLSAVPTTAGTGVSLAAGVKSVTGAITSTGKLSNGEEISGTGIQAGTTVSAVNEEAGTFTLSKVPGATGTPSLQADLPVNASAGTMRKRSKSSPRIGAGNVVEESFGARPPRRTRSSSSAPSPNRTSKRSPATTPASLAPSHLRDLNAQPGFSRIAEYEPNGTPWAPTRSASPSPAPSYYGVDVWGADRPRLCHRFRQRQGLRLRLLRELCSRKRTAPNPGPLSAKWKPRTSPSTSPTAASSSPTSRLTVSSTSSMPAASTSTSSATRPPSKTRCPRRSRSTVPRNDIRHLGDGHRQRLRLWPALAQVQPDRHRDRRR